ncbi:MAG: hypothetical protein ACO3UU_11705 [Minisyncoccia bacterium]
MDIKINNEHDWKFHLDIELADQLLYKVDVLGSEDSIYWSSLDTHQFAIQKDGEMDEDGHINITDEINAKINEEFNNKIQEIKDGYNLG